MLVFPRLHACQYHISKPPRAFCDAVFFLVSRVAISAMATLDGLHPSSSDGGSP
jgi:hypothetical protein